MKMNFKIFLCVLGCSVLMIYGQQPSKNRLFPDLPILKVPTNHDPHFTDFPERSFYESRNNWQQIIDTTWGSGLPLIDKQNIFNIYANALQNMFDGFLSLGMDWSDWDSLRSHYFLQITDSTSRGGFSALMSRLSHSLRDIHTETFDSVLLGTPLNPGIPILILSGFVTVQHFGAVLTVLPDSSLLVLRAVPNHPLGLQAGDIVLGYEGIPWRMLVQELLQAGLPLFPGCSIGAPSANADFHLLSAGMNWHLFNTIDIVQYSTGDTLHLPVAPMINLNAPPMLNNEQIEIPEIPFPNFFNGQIVNYGILNNTNIGYIYLFSEWPEETADYQFAQAVNALRNTEGLIIDMRLNFGGYALFDEAFDILFNEYHLTTDLALRLYPSSLTLYPAGNIFLFRIDADKASLYDHPIALLLGPTCVSMGDITAHRFRYHPTVRFFGKSPGASLGANIIMENVPNWFLRYSMTDQYHFNNPGSYLNRAEFPLDYPIWHNPDDAANGIDAVVEEALNWMNNLVYAHDLSMERHYFVPNIDTLHIEATVENPNSHAISSTVFIHNPDSTILDTIRLTRKMFASDSEIWSGEHLTPALEDNFRLSITAYDSTENQEFLIKNINYFTTLGPLNLDSYHVEAVLKYLSGYWAYIYLSVKNNSTSVTIPEVSVEISTEDTTIINIGNNMQPFGDILPGQTAISPLVYSLKTNNHPFIDTLKIKINMYSEGIFYWQDSTDVIVGIAQVSNNLPLEFALKQNYPNPFNPSTTIEFDLPKTGEVTLKVFNILGEEVTTLVSDRLSAGSYIYEWDASAYASGVYLYRLQAGSYVKTRKMVLMR